MPNDHRLQWIQGRENALEFLLTPTVILIMRCKNGASQGAVCCDGKVSASLSLDGKTRTVSNPHPSHRRGLSDDTPSPHYIYPAIFRVFTEERHLQVPVDRNRFLPVAALHLLIHTWYVSPMMFLILRPKLDIGAKRGAKSLLAVATEQGVVYVIDTSRRNAWEPGASTPFSYG